MQIWKSLQLQTTRPPSVPCKCGMRRHTCFVSQAGHPTNVACRSSATEVVVDFAEPTIPDLPWALTMVTSRNETCCTESKVALCLSESPDSSCTPYTPCRSWKPGSYKALGQPPPTFSIRSAGSSIDALATLRTRASGVETDSWDRCAGTLGARSCRGKISHRQVMGDPHSHPCPSMIDEADYPRGTGCCRLAAPKQAPFFHVCRYVFWAKRGERCPSRCSFAASSSRPGGEGKNASQQLATTIINH